MYRGPLHFVCDIDMGTGQKFRMNMNRLASLDSCLETTHQTLTADRGHPKPIPSAGNRWGMPKLDVLLGNLKYWQIIESRSLHVQLAPLDSWRLQCWCVLLGQTFCMLARWGFHLWELLRWLYCPGLPRSSCQFWRLSFRNPFCSPLTSIFNVTQMISHAGLRGFRPRSKKACCLMFFVDF